MRLVILLIVFLLPSCMFGQREAANWYFGKNAGLTFNSGRPQVLLDGQIDSFEGCSTYSSANGETLFYTDGKSIWDSYHNVMPNGNDLNGSPSSSQTGLVVPNPLQQDIFYVFTTDDALIYNTEGPVGFNYSVVDMSLNRGRGDVSQKNNNLLPLGSEKVSAVRNIAGNFYWVLTHYRDSFYAYRVDGTGVGASPVVSTVGPLIDRSENIRGSLKISPNGDKVAVAHSIVSPENEGSFYMFDFDLDSGTVSNPMLISDNRVYYGIEFSSNSSKLYASGIKIEGLAIGTTRIGNIELVQFDLNAPNVPTSEYVVHTFADRPVRFSSGSLQIGMDHKIYHAIPNESLSVIRNPNLQGMSCDFRPLQVELGGRESTYGLPPFVQSFFETILTIENFCEGEVTTFTPNAVTNIVTMSWNFGDPKSGSDNVSSDFNASHIFSSDGSFFVSLDVGYDNGSSRHYVELVEINKVPDIHAMVELIQCDVDGLDDGISKFNLKEAIALFENGNNAVGALFFSNISDAINNSNPLEHIGYVNQMNGETIFARAFEDSHCVAIVEIILNVRQTSDLGTYKSVGLCSIQDDLTNIEVDIRNAYSLLDNDFPGSTVKLYLSWENALLELDVLPKTPYLYSIAYESDIYFRIEDSNACDYIGKMDIEIIPKPIFDEVVPIIYCGDLTILSGLVGFDRYEWSTGDTTQTITITHPGTYQVTYFLESCSYIQKFEVSVGSKFSIQEIKIHDFKVNNELTVLVEGSVDGLLFSIDGGNEFVPSNKFGHLSPGIYEVVVTDGCTVLDKTVVVVGGLIPFFTPNNDGINDEWSLANAEFFPDFEIAIFDRYGNLLKIFRDVGVGWDGTFRSETMPSGDYWYKLVLGQNRVVTGHFALKR